MVLFVNKKSVSHICCVKTKNALWALFKCFWDVYPELFITNFCLQMSRI